MKYRPLLGDAMSGSAGGIVASHNRGGTYFRQRAIPTNPGSTHQDTVRQILSQLTSLWVTLLTDSQRASWDAYATNVTLPDRLGDSRNIGGIAQYVRSNVPRILVGLDRVDDGPTIYNLGDFTLPTIASITAPTALSLAFETSDDWVGEDGAALMVFGSRGQNLSINYFKGPYRYAGSVEGDSGTPPTSPAAITLPFALVADQKCFIKYAVTRADGRLSSSFRDYDIAV